MNAVTLPLKKKTFISGWVLFRQRGGNDMHDNALILSSAASTETHPFRCFIHQTCDYSPATESRPIKATSDQNLVVTIMSSAERKPGLDQLLKKHQPSQVTYSCGVLGATFPGLR